MPDNVTDKIPQLEDPKTLEKFKSFIDIIQLNDSYTDAWDLAGVLLGLFKQSPNFAEKEPELYKQYQAILIRSRWVGLPLLEESEIAELFEKHFIEGISLVSDIDIWQKLKAKLIGMLIYENRDKLKKSVRKALERNTQLITNEPLVIGTTKRDATIGNWIIDFSANMGDNFFDQVKVSQYFVAGQNIKKLPEVEKNKIKLLFDIYQKCGRSSFTTAGIEETIPVTTKDKKGVIREGRFEEIKQAEYNRLLRQIQEVVKLFQGGASSEIFPAELEIQRTKLTQAYLGSEQERARIHQEENEIEKLAGDNLSPLRQILLEAINQKDRYKAIAALRILAEKGDLPEELNEDLKIHNSFKNLLIKNYQPEILADFQRNGFIAPYLSIFLQRVLKNQIGLTEAESARIGIQLENILERKGNLATQGMVFGDLSKGEFVWHEVKDEGVRLTIPKEG